MLVVLDLVNGVVLAIVFEYQYLVASKVLAKFLNILEYTVNVSFAILAASKGDKIYCVEQGIHACMICWVF